MAKVLFKRKTTQEIEDLPVEDGALIYNTDNGKTYMDFKEERIQTGGNADTMIAIGGEKPTDEDIKIWFPDDTVKTKASEVINSMDGNETDLAPSVEAVKKYINNKKVKIITAERDGVADNEDVKYSELGFMPSRIEAIMVVNGTFYSSNGYSDKEKTNKCIYQADANKKYFNDSLVTYSNQGSWAQNGSIKSYDEDGFTITWTKIGNPTSGTMQMIFICYE